MPGRTDLAKLLSQPECGIGWMTTGRYLGGLPEDIPDNQENGWRALSGRFREGENAVIRPANQAGLLVHVR